MLIGVPSRRRITLKFVMVSYFVDGKIADHHYGYDFQPKFRIRSLDVADTLVEFGQQSTVYSTIQNIPGVS
jgi:hypothetical protein